MNSSICRKVLMSFALALSFLVTSVDAQQISGQTRNVKVPTIEPKAEDTSTLDGIIKAFYETISGPAGQPRQWARDRTLYIPNIRFVAMGVNGGKITSRILDHQSYVEWVNDGFLRDGFFEREIHRVTRRFGNTAHIFSTYEARQTPTGPVIDRGVNSIGLFHDGKRWWISSVMWDGERPDNPIPKDLLPSK